MIEREQENNDKNIELRKRAEEYLQTKSTSADRELVESLEEGQQLMAELQIYQVELELQNEELRETQERLLVQRERYAELYNFAPIAYFLLDENDIILNLNHSASQLLGKERAYLINRPLTMYLSPDSLQAFNVHREYVRYSGLPQVCELELRNSSKATTFVQARTTMLKDKQDGGGIRRVWRTVMTDITELKRTADRLTRSRNLLLALGRAAQSVLLATTPGEIYRAVGQQCRQLGFDFVVFVRDKENGHLKLGYDTLPGEFFERVDRLIDEQSLMTNSESVLDRLFTEEKVIYIPNVNDQTNLLLPKDIAELSKTLFQPVGVNRFLAAPLRVDDLFYGVMVVTGDDLEKEDGVAVEVFAAQVAISLHTTELNQKLQLALEREQFLAQTDVLTGVNNRRSLYQSAKREVAEAHRYARPLSLIMLDVDHFKLVNDTFGHAVGDQMLKHIANALQGELRSVDIIGRYGGEEFVILLPETSVAQAKQLAERLRYVVENSPLAHGDDLVSVTISLGVIELDSDNTDFDTLLLHVDQALYDAKKGGRNQFKVYS